MNINFLRNRSFTLMCSLLILAGCSGKDSGNSSPPDVADIEIGTEGEEHSHDHDHDHEAPEDGLSFELDTNAKSTLGPWLMYASLQEKEVPLGVVAVQPIDAEKSPEGNLKAGFVQTLEKAGKIEPGRSTATMTTVQFEYTQEGSFQIFAGELKDGVIYGNILTGEGRCSPARLLRPKEQLSHEPEPEIAAGANALSEVLNEGGDWDNLISFVEENPFSPLTVNAFYTLSSQLGPREISLEQIQELMELIDKTLDPWGNRLKQYTRLNTLIQIVNLYQHSEYLKEIHESLVGQFPEPMWENQTKFILDSVSEELETIRLLENLRTSEAETRDEILESLHQTLVKDRFNFNMIRATIDTLIELGDQEKAIDWCLKFVAVPGLDQFYLGQFRMYATEIKPARVLLKELWADVQRDEKQLDAAIEQAYDELIESYEFPDLELPEDNGRRVLVELFTGTSCPPCVAADITFSKLKDNLPSDRVVFLQYHVHVPAADPMTVDGSTGRYHYYSPPGTPTTIIDGRPLEGVSGPASLVGSHLRRVGDEIVEELKLDPPLELDVQFSKNEQQETTFTASVKADEIEDRWRLHVILAEEVVRYTGTNEVPYHEMVVRHVYTQSQGQASDGSGLAYKGKIDLDEVRAGMEQEMSKLRDRGVTLDGAPQELQNLHLVVFVQDNKNMRIRQAVSLPVPSASDAKVSALTAE